jgi:hypothetical protein
MSLRCQVQLYSGEQLRRHGDVCSTKGDIYIGEYRRQAKYQNIYIYIYIEKERERDREREKT